LNGPLGEENAMSDRYTVFGIYDEEWVHEVGLTRIEVRYERPKKVNKTKEIAAFSNVDTNFRYKQFQ
jgi:hypothetical protein